MLLIKNDTMTVYIRVMNFHLSIHLARPKVLWIRNIIRNIRIIRINWIIRIKWIIRIITISNRTLYIVNYIPIISKNYMDFLLFITYINRALWNCHIRWYKEMNIRILFSFFWGKIRNLVCIKAINYTPWILMIISSFSKYINKIWYEFGAFFFHLNSRFSRHRAINNDWDTFLLNRSCLCFFLVCSAI